MPSRLSLRTMPSLPDHLLRQLLQNAASADRGTALCLSLLCRSIQSWIEDVIYDEVVLSHKNKAHAFLRTIQTSRTKSPEFFATHVKSLFICPDLDPMDVVTLLSTCRGVVNLSYWPLVHSSSPNAGIDKSERSLGLIRPDPWQRRSPSPVPYQSHAQRRETRSKINKFIASVAFHNMEHLSPRRLSLLLSETHPIFTSRPTFNIPFFASVTHLSIANRWEEWTTWAGGAISSLTMPHLTHVKLDLAVGQAPREDVSRSRARWLSTVTDGWSSPEECCPSNEEKEALLTWTKKINVVAGSLSDILTRSQSLEVCVLVLRFDSNPTRTAKHISRVMATRIGEEGMSSFGAGLDAGFDARLVFAWEREPFRYGHAHSSHELSVWRAAEKVVKMQQQMSGYTVLNCDFLS